MPSTRTASTKKIVFGRTRDACYLEGRLSLVAGGPHQTIRLTMDLPILDLSSFGVLGMTAKWTTTVIVDMDRAAVPLSYFLSTHHHNFI